MKSLKAIKNRGILWGWPHSPHCDEMARLVSRQFDRTVPLPVRLRMRLHFMFCAWCRRYSEQVAFLRRATPCLQESPTPASQGLTLVARHRIAQRLLRAEASFGGAAPTAIRC